LSIFSIYIWLTTYKSELPIAKTHENHIFIPLITTKRLNNLFAILHQKENDPFIGPFLNDLKVFSFNKLLSNGASLSNYENDINKYFIINSKEKTVKVKQIFVDYLINQSFYYTFLHKEEEDDDSTFHLPVCSCFKSF
jgi:hypothetical protein